MCLSGAPYLVETYERYGFKVTGWSAGWFKWTVDASQIKSYEQFSILDLKQGNFPSIIKYDSEIVGMERSEWLNLWLINKPNTVVKVAYDGPNIVGYAAIQPAYKGYQLGPLYADDNKAAESLLKALLNTVPAENTFFAFTCDENPEMRELMTKIKIHVENSDRVIPMYTREWPNTELSKVYLLSSASVQYA